MRIMTVMPGTMSASVVVMRALWALVLLGGCFTAGSSGGGGSRAGVMPMLSELPTDATKRDAILDSSNTAAGPEHRKGMTVKERKAETAAATAAAIIGSMFSKTQSVTIGSASTFDENQLSGARALPLPRPTANGTDDAPVDPAAPDAGQPGVVKPAAPPPTDPAPSNADLIPWIKLK